MVTWGIFVIFLIYLNMAVEMREFKYNNPFHIIYAFTIAMLLMEGDF